MPILLKDNIETADRDGHECRGPSPSRKHHARKDAFIVENACARPARSILGKTNLSEWANFRSTQEQQRLEWPGGAVPEPLCPRP
jgi:amidase